jgi:GH43 family beta-xylosidase
MMHAGEGRTYMNPVYDRACADPFVLKYCGAYWCYCSGFGHDGRSFGILHSQDLVDWRELPGAMAPLPGGHTCYWAPEVTYLNRRFYLYYSVGNEERMQVRVAVAEQPAGPYKDSGHRLTTEDFAIDAHVFEDDDGARYLFYATDFLTHSHIGTGTVVDRLLDPFTLAGQPRPVTRARFDWQVYDPQRAAKGGVRWHTVEGPFVLKRKGRYYQMFSGGNWQNVSYGVSYATSDQVEAPEEWEQSCDGERVRPILRTLQGEVIGPGHNSVVRGPDNQQLFCVYHRWARDGSARVLCIDRLDWAGDRMVVLGPSTTPQPAPARPSYALGADWIYPSGRWAVQDGVATQTSVQGKAEARLDVGVACFVVEVSLRASSPSTASAAHGVGLRSEAGDVMRYMIAANQAEPGARIAWRVELGGWHEQAFALPAGFDLEAYHLLRVEVDGERATLALDGAGVRWQSRLSAAPTGVALVTEDTAASFAGLGLTVGWEDQFVQPNAAPGELGWQVLDTSASVASAGRWSIRDGYLYQDNRQAERTVLAKGAPLLSYELVVNARLVDNAEAQGSGYGFYPALGKDDLGPLCCVERSERGWVLRCDTPAGSQRFALPDFDARVDQQFHFRKESGERQARLVIQWEALVLGEMQVSLQPSRVGLVVQQAAAAFDMVRVTAIP